MVIEKTKLRIKCELGACANRADFAVYPARSGVRSCLYLCGDCLNELSVLGRAAVGKSVKPAQKSASGEGRQ